MSTSEEPWSVGRLLQWTIDYLGKHGAENPRLDAEVLLAHARGSRRIDLYAAYGEVADEKTRTEFRDLVRHRASGTPVAYLVGHREFYSLDFEVTPDVLIPRPETEHLVVALLDHAKSRVNGDARIEIVDVGTGSGIIAVCAAKYLPNSFVTAVDISSAAIAVAKRNAKKHAVADRIEFIESNLFANISTDRRFDYIVSNPPYVSTAEMKEVARDVREYEPAIALRAGERGTDVIAPLIDQATNRLRPGGALLIEISPMIMAEVEALISTAKSMTLGAMIRDLSGHPRVLRATK